MAVLRLRAIGTENRVYQGVRKIDYFLSPHAKLINLFERKKRMQATSIVQSIGDLLFELPSTIFLGFILCGLGLVYFSRKEPKRLNLKQVIASLLLFCYLLIVFQSIVGIPTISEFKRMMQLGENLFNAHLYLIPFGEGIKLTFMLNILLFVPIGFLLPLISPVFKQAKATIPLVFSLSLLIELSQLFTLYRATDINDLIANTFGGIIGFFICFCLTKLSWRKARKSNFPTKNSVATSRFLPIFICVLAFLTIFIS